MTKSSSFVPFHVAIIMDGNGRWAEKRHLPRTEGHKEGVRVVRNITKASAVFGVRFLTLFAFSTENWRRGEREVNFLFNLFVESVDSYIPELKEQSVRLNFIGDMSGLPAFLRKSLQLAENETKKGEKMLLNIALNYGSRREILDAVRLICESKKEVNEENFSSFLYTTGIPDPDLIIRTSGEMRLSNFLLYQSAYSELFFTETLWPDFTEEEYLSILKKFGERNRKFGGI